jgi:hypothetical protein
MTRTIRVAIAVAALTGGAACARSVAAPTPVANGNWGGDRIAMAVASTSTHIELDCAHGDLPLPLTTDVRGEFNVAGTFVREHGGPIRDDEATNARPAAYAGTVRSNQMSLSIRLTDTGELVGAFTLTFGAQGRIVKCL